MATLLFVCVLVFPPSSLWEGACRQLGRYYPIEAAGPAGEVCECVQRLHDYRKGGTQRLIEGREGGGWSADGDGVRVT